MSKLGVFADHLHFGECDKQEVFLESFIFRPSLYLNTISDSCLVRFFVSGNKNNKSMSLFAIENPIQNVYLLIFYQTFSPHKTLIYVSLKKNNAFLFNSVFFCLWNKAQLILTYPAEGAIALIIWGCTPRLRWCPSVARSAIIFICRSEWTL